MSEDIKGIPTRELGVAGTKKRAGNGAVVLFFLGASFLLQAVISTVSAFNYAPDLFTDARSDDQSAELIGNLIIYYGLVLFVLILAFFALFMRSRIAMILGLGVFALNWVGIIWMLISGEFSGLGLVLNIAGPIYLWIGLHAAMRYHHLLKTPSAVPDIGVF
jgi:hypothetical protein